MDKDSSIFETVAGILLVIFLEGNIGTDLELFESFSLMVFPAIIKFYTVATLIELDYKHFFLFYLF